MKAEEVERRLHRLEIRFANLVRFLAVADVSFFDAPAEKRKRPEKARVQHQRSE